MSKNYNMKEGYKTFRDRIYSYLVAYNERYKTSMMIGNIGSRYADASYRM